MTLPHWTNEASAMEFRDRHAMAEKPEVQAWLVFGSGIFDFASLQELYLEEARLTRSEVLEIWALTVPSTIVDSHSSLILL